MSRSRVQATQLLRLTVSVCVSLQLPRMINNWSWFPEQVQHGSRDYLVVEFETLLGRSNGRQDGETVDTGLDVRGSSLEES